MLLILMTEIKYTLYTRISGMDLVAFLNITYYTEVGGLKWPL
jgi:hypothetical protein